MNLDKILSALRQERDRLDQAIAALEGSAGKRTGRRHHGITAAGRKRLSQMMKKRWAERRKRAKAA